MQPGNDKLTSRANAGGWVTPGISLILATAAGALVFCRLLPLMTDIVSVLSFTVLSATVFVNVLAISLISLCLLRDHVHGAWQNHLSLRRTVSPPLGSHVHAEKA